MQGPAPLIELGGRRAAAANTASKRRSSAFLTPPKPAVSAAERHILRPTEKMH